MELKSLTKIKVLRFLVDTFVWFCKNYLFQKEMLYSMRKISYRYQNGALMNGRNCPCDKLRST